MAIEGLNAKISSDVPQAHGFVATAADENLTEGLAYVIPQCRNYAINSKLRNNHAV